MFELTILLLFLSFGYSEGSNKKVLLARIDTLTFYRGEWTNSRRSPSIHQLKCVDGSACDEFTPAVVQCHNKGTDGNDIQWKCEADMSSDYRFGRMEVNCEGFDYPEDPYVLVGSCGLEYTLDLTEAALKRRGQSWGQWEGGFSGGKTAVSSGVGFLLLLVIIAGVALCIFCRTVMPYVQSPDTASVGDAMPPGPPPPGFRPEFSNPQPPLYPSFDSSAPQPPPYSAHEFAGSSTQSGTGSSSQRGSGGPGFWTGATTGGLLGFLFGRWTNGGQSQSQAHWWGGQPRTNWWAPSGGSAPGSGWYGGSGFGSAPAAGSSSSNSNVGDSHTATGFARTRRR